MEPHVEPTTPLRQRHIGEDPELEQDLRVERGWMEPPGPAITGLRSRRSDSLAITAFTAAVVIGFVFFALVLFPLVLLAGS